MLKLDQVSKTFGNHTVLSQVSCEFKKGVNVVFGNNGSGKSTLLKIIAGIVAPDFGDVLLDNLDLINLDPEERNIGYVPQKSIVFKHLTVLENIQYSFRNNRGKSEQSQQLIEMLGLQSVIKKSAGVLSGGFQSRVALARALASEPKILLMDEALSGLDSEIKAELCEQMKVIFDNLAIPTIFVTHDLLEAKKLGEYFFELKHGKLVPQIG